jgi:hypothetical protein
MYKHCVQRFTHVIVCILDIRPHLTFLINNSFNNSLTIYRTCLLLKSHLDKNMLSKFAVFFMLF